MLQQNNVKIVPNIALLVKIYQFVMLACQDIKEVPINHLVYLFAYKDSIMMFMIRDAMTAQWVV